MLWAFTEALKSWNVVHKMQSSRTLEKLNNKNSSEYPCSSYERIQDNSIKSLNKVGCKFKVDIILRYIEI